MKSPTYSLKPAAVPSKPDAEAALQKALAFWKERWPDRQPTRDDLSGLVILFMISPKGIRLIRQEG